MQAAKGFASGDLVRRMGYRELLPGPFAGRVIYSNPKTGKVHVQWPWGVEEEPATELIRDISSDTTSNDSLDQWLPTLDGVRFINDEKTEKADAKWRKSLSSRVADRYLRASFSSQLVARYEELTKPAWRLACKAWYHDLDEVGAYRAVFAACGKDFGDDCCRRTVANLYESARRNVAIYWKDSGRRYKVTNKEKETQQLLCPRCKGLLKPRVYRQGKNCMQCKGCGFTISPKDLVWDESVQTGEEVFDTGQILPGEVLPGEELPVEESE